MMALHRRAIPVAGRHRSIVPPDLLHFRCADPENRATTSDDDIDVDYSTAWSISPLKRSFRIDGAGFPHPMLTILDRDSVGGISLQAYEPLSQHKGFVMECNPGPETGVPCGGKLYPRFHCYMSRSPTPNGFALVPNHNYPDHALLVNSLPAKVTTYSTGDNIRAYHSSLEVLDWENECSLLCMPPELYTRMQEGKDPSPATKFQDPDLPMLLGTISGGIDLFDNVDDVEESFNNVPHIERFASTDVQTMRHCLPEDDILRIIRSLYRLSFITDHFDDAEDIWKCLDMLGWHETEHKFKSLSSQDIAPFVPTSQ